jgi:hypothetical protein
VQEEQIMNVLTATSRGQGRRASDFTWCIEGELVMPGIMTCSRDEREGADGGCGCGRSWTGLNSAKSTTTALVSDLDGFTFGDVEMAVRSFLEHSGWLALLGDDAEATVTGTTAEIIGTAGSFPARTVLEIRLGAIAVRGELSGGPS